MTLAADFGASMQRLSRTLIQLNLATQEHHAEADAPWLALRLPTVGVQDYVDQLIKVYGFEAPLEAALHYTPGLGALVDLRARTRCGLIVQDLIRLGLSPARIAGLTQRFITFSTPAEALGWLYVAERATLIHGAVRRCLRVRLPEVAEASSYLSAYDGVAATRWAMLGGALDAIAYVPALRCEILRAANEGFLALRAWFEARDTYRALGT